jgi:hypothetical protein
VILRIYRGRIIAPAEEALLARIRDCVAKGLPMVHGLRAWQPGIRRTVVGSELVLVSTWDDYESIAAPRRQLDSPVALPSLGSMLEDAHADHYELVVEGSPRVPAAGAPMRLVQATLQPNAEAAFFARVRGVAQDLLDETAVASAALGRRSVGQVSEVVIVTVWTDEAALLAVAGPGLAAPITGPDTARFLLSLATAEHFDVVGPADPSDAPLGAGTAVTDRPDPA